MKAEFDFEMFKAQLLGFFKAAHIDVCFKDSIRETKTPKELKRLFESYADDIAEEFGASRKRDFCDECDDKEDQITALEREIEELEGCVTHPVTGERNLIYQMKQRVFMSNCDNYSIDEIEEMFTRKKAIQSA